MYKVKRVIFFRDPEEIEKASEGIDPGEAIDVYQEENERLRVRVAVLEKALRAIAAVVNEASDGAATNRDAVAEIGRLSSRWNDRRTNGGG